MPVGGFLLITFILSFVDVSSWEYQLLFLVLSRPVISILDHELLSKVILMPIFLIFLILFLPYLLHQGLKLSLTYQLAGNLHICKGWDEGFLDHLHGGAEYERGRNHKGECGGADDWEMSWVYELGHRVELED